MAKEPEVLGKYIHEHKWEPTPPKVKVEVTKGQKGDYGWTIGVELPIEFLGEKYRITGLKIISDVDQKLKEEFYPNQYPKKEDQSAEKSQNTV
jgi:hypothetical protein